MHINEFNRLEADPGESFKISFDASSNINPNAQLPDRTLIIHAPTNASLAGAVSTLKEQPPQNGALLRSTHLILGEDGNQMVQMVPFQLGANHASFVLNKQSIGIDLVYPGELFEKGFAFQLKSSFQPDQYILASGLANESRFGYWPLYPREQLDSLLLVAKTLMSKYHIVDVVAHDEVLSASHPGPAFPIIQFREKLLGVNERSLLLQETSRSVQLLGEPGQKKSLLSQLPIPEATPVCVINERFDWYLISVIAEVGGNPWLIGWVKKDAVRVKTDFVAEVTDQHYATADGRRFLEITPHPNGYDTSPDDTKPEFIIMHYTTGTRMESTINHFKDPASQVSTHLLIGRDGRVVQFLPFHRIAHHSGFSWWEGQSNLNKCSIGIELDNVGLLIRKDNKWQRRKIIVPNKEVKRAIHKNMYDTGKRKTYPGWQKFTDVQVAVAFKIVQALVKKYPSIKEILGHDDVNITNRYDTGPLFEDKLSEWRQALFGRPEPIIEEHLINHQTDIYANFQGRLPNPTQKTFDIPLPAKSVVKVLKQDGDFSLVTVIQTKEPKAKGTGWIKTAALEEVSKPHGGGGGNPNQNPKKKGKGGHDGNNGNKKNKNLEDKRRTTMPQLLFRRGEDSPTPKLSEGPFDVGTRVRIQERRGEWTLVVLLERYKQQGGLEGWMPTEFLSSKDEMPMLAPATPRAADPQTASVPLWQHKDDRGALGGVRDCAPCPAVFTLHESRVTVTKEWQFFIRAINPQMSIQHVAALFGHKKAFTNRREKDLRRDYLQGEHLDRDELEFDKVRTCSLSVLSGEPQGDMLLVAMLDGNKPPPLKPGCPQPQRVEDIKLDDYLFTPQTHRHLFFAANIVRPNGKVSPFPHGEAHTFMNDGRPYTWMPHVSRFQVHYPLAKLMRLPPGSPIPIPYQ